MSVFPVIALGAVTTSGPNDACTALEKTSHACDADVKGEMGLGSCPDDGMRVILPIEGASENETPSRSSEYFSATGLMRS